MGSVRKIEVELNEDNGLLKYYGARLVLPQEGFYSHFQKSLEQVDPKLAHRLMYENGEESTKEAVSAAERTFIAASRIALDKRKLIEKLLLLSLERGFGLMRIGSFDYSRGKGTVLMENSVIARTYGKSKKPVCFLLAGVISGASQIVYGTSFSCVESECQAAGARQCEFELSPCSAEERLKFLEKIT